jgi:Flp pilus assembly protein TadD
MKGSNSDAISQFQTIVSAGTADATDLRTLGSLALANGRPADGIEPFERLLTTNMNDTDARLKLVECLSKSGQLAKAIEACRNGFKVDAGHTAQYTAMLEKLKTSGSMQNSSVKPVANDNGG